LSRAGNGDVEETVAARFPRFQTPAFGYERARKIWKDKMVTRIIVPCEVTRDGEHRCSPCIRIGLSKTEMQSSKWTRMELEPVNAGYDRSTGVSLRAPAVSVGRKF